MVSMSYKVLYRKYRPDSFNKIIGQTSIVETLKNSVTQGTFSHAYIFTGPRGTGKTSTAKVLSKTINCTNLKDGEACGECENCKNFSTSPDIIEIDAASNNGVDEIRELRNNITLAPAASKYKIYIIDEVHMLSQGAFNALLKTLEEPPSHAIFILATTEVYKVPITILSRCQRYDFKKINSRDLIAHLRAVCSQEKIEFEENSLEEIYALSEGCARDALSILDQLSKAHAKITLGSVLETYNIISNRDIDDLLTAIQEKNVEKIVDLIDRFEDSGTNAQKILKKMINYYEKRAISLKLGEKCGISFTIIDRLIKNLNSCYIDARINENVFTMIKMSFLELIDTCSSTITAKESNSKSTQSPIMNVTPKVDDLALKNSSEGMSLTEIRINNCFVDVNKDSLKAVLDAWTNLGDKKISTIDPQNFTPVASSNQYAIFTTEEDSLANLFNIKAQDIEKALKKKDLAVKVVAITAVEWNKEKEKFKANRIKKIKYQLLEEPLLKDDGAEIKGQLDTLFTEKIIEIS